MSKTLAGFRMWWNAEVKALEASAGQAHQWGRVTDDDLMQPSGQPEEGALDYGRVRSRATLRTDSDIRAWLSAHGLVDKT